MLEFLNPFLWGLVFGLIPIFIYLFKFYTKKVYILPTITILDEEKKTKGLNVNVEFLKLILRVLIIVLIVLIFSQPFVSKGGRDEVVFVIDNTYSAKDNFERYLRYIKERVSSLPDGKRVRIIDLSGKEIEGYKRDVIDKIRYYFPEVGKLNEEFFSRLKGFSGAEVLVLTDGQKNFIEKVKKAGVDVKFIKFPYSIPNGRVSFSIWKRFGNEVEFKYEIVCEDECLVEIVLESQNYQNRLFSSKVKGRKVGEMKVVSSVEGIQFLKGIVMNDYGTNEFVEPVYLGNVGFNLVSEVSLKELESAFKVIGIKREGSYSVVVKKFVNVDNLRNSIVIPYDENSKVLIKGTDVLRGNEKKSFRAKEINLSSLPIRLIANVSVPEGVEVYGVDNRPVFVYDRSRNNIVLLGYLNWYSEELPWFLKEIVEFLLVGSKVNYSYPYGMEGVKIIDFKDGIFNVVKIPLEELDKLEDLENLDNSRYANFLPLILFCVLMVVMVAERIVSNG